MQLRKLLTDDSAVSEVIGVILMVGITVLLAATAASFFIGLGQQSQSETPTVAVSFDYDQQTTSSGVRDDQLTVKHNGGDTLDASTISIAVQDAANGGGELNPRKSWEGWSGASSVSEITAGDSVTIDRSDTSGTSLSLDQATAKVTWNPSDNTQSFVLASWNGPGTG